MENLPSYIIEWIENRPYESLAKEEQQQLEAFFTPEEYKKLHLAATVIREDSLQEKQLARKAEIRANLLDRFDRKHRPVFQPSMGKLTFWKVAALFLFIGLGSFQYFLLRKVSQTQPMALADTDTVYIIKEVPAEKVKEYDTVYIVQREKNNRGTMVKKQFTRHDMLNDNMPMPLLSDINVVPLESLNKRQNSHKGRSIKEDTLIKKIGFVSL
jgi:hypothetical protein